MKETGKDVICEDADSGLKILNKIKKCLGRFQIWPIDPLLSSIKPEVNTMDFLNFIRPGTRSGNEMYGLHDQTAVVDTETEVKWDDIFASEIN